MMSLKLLLKDSRLRLKSLAFRARWLVGLLGLLSLRLRFRWARRRVNKITNLEDDVRFHCGKESVHILPIPGTSSWY